MNSNKNKICSKLINIIGLIFIIATLSQSYAINEDINSYEYLQVEIENIITYGITTEKEHYIESLTLNSFFFPASYENSQALNSFESTETYILKNSETTPYIQYDIKNNIDNINTIQNSFKVQSTIDKPQIKSKILFPQINIDENYENFTTFSGLIDTNEVIRAQASKLAEGEDDTYIIASKIAKWIQEDITYDLSTITANPNQKSSDVFKSKVGVCKEITHLYISMMRSLGIPAQVVTGYAYTNSQEVIDLVGSNWGGHAWAEVLIGDTWVPFDLTYNQYGYVDASHIVLDKSKEIRLQSTTIEGRGRNFEIVPNSLSNKNSFIVVDKKERIINPGFSIEIEGPQELAPNSYGHIKVRVENTQDYYQNIFLNLAKVPKIELLDLSKQMVILKPEETKEILFRYKIPELESGYVYSFPFNIYNQFFEEEYIVSVQENNEFLEEHSLPEVIVSQKTFSENGLQFSCSGEVSYPKNKILCTLKNPNNYELYNVDICSDTSCQKIDFKVNEQKTIELETINFESELEIIYNNKIETTTISIPKPSFSFTNISTKKQNIYIEYEIENNYEPLSSKITINSSLSENIDSKKVSKEYNLESGTYNITIEILNQDSILETYSKTLIIKELTLFEKIEKFFVNIFNLFF